VQCHDDGKLEVAPRCSYLYNFHREFVALFFKELLFAYALFRENKNGTGA
jgi:hypothetical protein